MSRAGRWLPVALLLAVPAVVRPAPPEDATRPEPRQVGGNKGGVAGVDISPDGKLVASAGGDQTLGIWDVATGKQVRRCAGNHGCVYALHLSPDGKMIVAGASDGALHLFDFATGKEVRKIQDQPQGAVYAAAFSPDGRTVASGDSSTARLWEVATGREIWRVSGIKAEFSSMAFSPDGRILYGGSYDSTVHVYEVATGREVRKLRGHREWVWNLNLTPDGRLLASGSKDGRALVWNVVEAARPAKRLKLTPADLEARWADLAAEDPGRGFPAVAALSAAPGQSVPFLRQRLTALLKPAPGLSPERIAQLIRDLDSDEFAVRKKASQELEKAGKQAEAALRQTLTGEPSLEVRRRVERLLAKLERAGLTPDELRMIRAVQALEQARTPEARQALEALAKGPAGHRLAEEAASALGRLNKQARKP